LGWCRYEFRTAERFVLNDYKHKIGDIVEVKITTPLIEFNYFPLNVFLQQLTIKRMTTADELWFGDEVARHVLYAVRHVSAERCRSARNDANGSATNSNNKLLIAQ